MCVLMSSAYEIIRLKGYTSWGIGTMVSTLCSAILRNQRNVYALSTLVEVTLTARHSLKLKQNQVCNNYLLCVDLLHFHTFHPAAAALRLHIGQI